MHPEQEPLVNSPRPGDVILLRAIKWWDSGQLKRAMVGLVITVGPVLLDLWDKQALTWRSVVSIIAGAIFTRMAYSRAKAPDVITGTKFFDGTGK